MKLKRIKFILITLLFSGFSGLTILNCKSFAMEDSINQVEVSQAEKEGSLEFWCNHAMNNDDLLALFLEYLGLLHNCQTSDFYGYTISLSRNPPHYTDGLLSIYGHIRMISDFIEEPQKYKSFFEDCRNKARCGNLTFEQVVECFNNLEKNGVVLNCLELCKSALTFYFKNNKEELTVEEACEFEKVVKEIGKVFGEIDASLKKLFFKDEKEGSLEYWCNHAMNNDGLLELFLEYLGLLHNCQTSNFYGYMIRLFRNPPHYTDGLLPIYGHISMISDFIKEPQKYKSFFENGRNKARCGNLTFEQVVECFNNLEKSGVVLNCLELCKSALAFYSKNNKEGLTVEEACEFEKVVKEIGKVFGEIDASLKKLFFKDEKEGLSKKIEVNEENKKEILKKDRLDLKGKDLKEQFNFKVGNLFAEYFKFLDSVGIKKGKIYDLARLLRSSFQKEYQTINEKYSGFFGTRFDDIISLLDTAPKDFLHRLSNTLSKPGGVDLLDQMEGRDVSLVKSKIENFVNKDKVFEKSIEKLKRAVLEVKNDYYHMAQEDEGFLPSVYITISGKKVPAHRAFSCKSLYQFFSWLDIDQELYRKFNDFIKDFLNIIDTTTKSFIELRLSIKNLGKKSDIVNLEKPVDEDVNKKVNEIIEFRDNTGLKYNNINNNINNIDNSEQNKSKDNKKTLTPEANQRYGENNNNINFNNINLEESNNINNNFGKRDGK